MVGGEIEVDESYFDGKRKGGVYEDQQGKLPVFGLLLERRKDLYEDHS